jgi:hypothetical protein
VEDENGRNAVSEFLVQSLMMPGFHSKPGTNTATNDSHPQQGSLRDSPSGFPRFPFVDSVHQECPHIDYSKINQQYLNDGAFFHLLIIVEVEGLLLWKLRGFNNRLLLGNRRNVCINLHTEFEIKTTNGSVEHH